MNFNPLFEKITKSTKCFNLKKNKADIVIKSTTLDGKGLLPLMEAAKLIVESKYKDLDLKIIFKAYQIADDSIIQQLEIIFAYIFTSPIKYFRVHFDNMRQTSPHYHCFKKSIFYRMNFSLDKTRYLKEFYRSSYSDKNYFRYYIDINKIEEQENIIMADAFNFIQMHSKDPAFCMNLSKTFAEMIDNVRHAESDCIATLKFTDTLRNTETGKKANAFCINVVDISNFCITTKISQLIDEKKLSGNTKKIISKSLPFHAKYFSNNYDFEKFCFISVFQNRITTDSESEIAGGTGLPKLVQTLNDSDIMICYAVSGRNILYFRKDFIKMNSNGFIGFNKENDYLRFPPDTAVFSKAPFYYSGALFLLEIFKE